MKNKSSNINYEKFTYTSMNGIIITKRNGKDQHRYIPTYPLETGMEYLIIGTIHPNSKPEIDYYYGNVGSFWDILKSIYPNYNFESTHQIREWQRDFSIEITDTIIQCKRKSETANDSDIIVEEEDYHWALKEYILSNRKTLKRLLFTSGEGTNAAYKNFKKIMGNDFLLIEPLCTVLPSPSRSSTLALFKGKEEHYGLVLPFYEFLKSHYPDALEYAKETFIRKQSANEKIKRLPKNKINYTKEYKVFEYKKHFPIYTR